MNNSIRVNQLFLIFLLIVSGCKPKMTPKGVRQNIQFAGKNKIELKKVFNHYNELNDADKLEAVYFLIGNMKDKYGIESESLYAEYSILESINHQKNKNALSQEELNTLLKEKLDSLHSRHGNVQISPSEIKSDLETITADFLIKNIDQAFEVWKKPWARHVSFTDFCEFILPYRIHNEAVSNWREMFYNEFKHFEDSLNNPKDPKELTTLLSNYLYNQWNHLSNFSISGVYPDLISMARFNGGQCDHRYFLFTAMCRSMGLPVGIDMTPQWTTAPRGHSWNFLIDTNGRKRPFNGAEDNMRFYEKNLIPMEDGGYVCTKVFRQTFSNQKHSLPRQISSNEKKFIPVFFQTNNISDVTWEYDMTKAECKIPISPKHKNKTIYLFTYALGKDLNPVAWGKVEEDSVDFGYIGVPAFYIPAIFNTVGGVDQVSYSLLWPVQEEYRQYYNPDLKNTGSAKIYRKYYASGAFSGFAHEMVGGKIQGSSNLNFSDAVELAIIDKQPDAFHELTVSNNSKFRYIRYLPNKNSPIHLAEMEIWGLDKDRNEIKLNGKPIGLNYISDNSDSLFRLAFDNNIRTNFNAEPGSWIGIDLSENNLAQVTKIWILPRNNFNIIEAGHKYELFYLKKNLEWKSLGKRNASEHYLKYDNIPCEAMLLLKDYSGGKEERLFLYNCESHIQHWF